MSTIEIDNNQMTRCQKDEISERLDSGLKDQAQFMTLSKSDTEALVDALLNKTEPNNKLKKAAARYLQQH